MHHRTTIAALAACLCAPLLAQEAAKKPRWLLRQAARQATSQQRPLLCFVRPTGVAKRLDVRRSDELRANYHARVERVTTSLLRSVAKKEPPLPLPMATAQEEFETSLSHLMLTPDLALYALLAGSRLATATADEVGAKPGETVVLLGPDAGRIAGAAVEVSDDDAVRKAIAPWVTGEELANDPAHIPSLTLIWNGMLFDELRFRLEPLGTRWDVDVSLEDACRGCGMAATGSAIRRVLKLLD